MSFNDYGRDVIQYFIELQKYQQYMNVFVTDNNLQFETREKNTDHTPDT